MTALPLLLFLSSPGNTAYGEAAQNEFVHLFEQVDASIVNVISVSDWDGELDRSRIDSLNERMLKRRRGMGAGFFIDAHGNIVTNAHVVAGAAMIFVQTRGSSVLHRAKVKGAEHRYDLALLSTGLRRTAPLQISRKDAPPVGTWVAIIGNPLGIGSTLSVGVVGAVGRSVLSEKFEDYLQLSASVNPGNSGGPVLDLAGEVVGVLTMKASGHNVEGVAFAVPAYMVQEVVSQLREKGYFQRVWIGVEVRDLGFEERGKEPRRVGAVVTAIRDGSPARQSGLRVGDTLTKLNGRSLRDKRDLAHRLLTVKRTDGLRFTVVGEDGRTRDVNVPFGLEDDSLQRKNKYLKSLELGLTLQELTPHLRIRWELPGSVSGLLVSRVADGGRGAQSGLQRGDVVRRVGGKPVEKLRGFVDALHDCLKKGPCSIEVVRKGEGRSAVVQPL